MMLTVMMMNLRFTFVEFIKFLLNVFNIYAYRMCKLNILDIRLDLYDSKTWAVGLSKGECLVMNNSKKWFGCAITFCMVE